MSTSELGQGCVIIISARSTLEPKLTSAGREPGRLFPLRDSHNDRHAERIKQFRISAEVCIFNFFTLCVMKNSTSLVLCKEYGSPGLMRVCVYIMKR